MSEINSKKHAFIDEEEIKMSENENMKLNDEMMEKATGGENLERGRKEPGTVIGFFDQWEKNKYRVKRDSGPEAIASYYPTAGPLLEPGTRVMIELVGMGKWDIVDFI